MGQRLDDGGIQQRAGNEGNDDTDERRRHQWHSPRHQLPDKVSGQHRHFALREIDDTGRTITEDKRKRERRVDRAIRETVDNLAGEKIHSYPK